MKEIPLLGSSVWITVAPGAVGPGAPGQPPSSAGAQIGGAQQLAATSGLQQVRVRLQIGILLIGYTKSASSNLLAAISNNPILNTISLYLQVDLGRCWMVFPVCPRARLGSSAGPYIYFPQDLGSSTTLTPPAGAQR